MFLVVLSCLCLRRNLVTSWVSRGGGGRWCKQLSGWEIPLKNFLSASVRRCLSDSSLRYPRYLRRWWLINCCSVFCWHLFLTSSFDTKSFQEDPSQPPTMSRFQMTIVCFCMSPSLGTTRLLNRRTRNTQSTLLCPNWKQLLSIERTIIRMLSLSLQAFISCYTYAYFSLL